jgi:protein-S-isoprenylcysteine O-methyltransferase Ste14
MSLALFTAALVFLGANTLDWSAGQLFSLVYLLCWAGSSVALARRNPDLLNQRGKRTRQLSGTKRWDWLLLSLYTLVTLVQPFLAGLDYRYGWSAASSSLVYLAGNLLMLAAFALLTWAMVINRHFEGTVRIQEQRGHRVITSGPYRYVRHPGYVAVILTFFALPIALGAWAALIPAIAGLVVFVIRTALEDRTLQAELPGYAEYAQHTRYRLLPGVW